MIRTPLPPLLLALCLHGLAAAQAEGPAPKAKAEAEVRLRYHFEKLHGHVATYRIQTVLRQRKWVESTTDVERAGKTGKERGEGEAVSTTRQTYELRFEKGERGLGKVFMTPRRVEASLEENGVVAYRFDSKQGEAPPKQLEGMTEQLNKTATLVVTNLGEVKKVKGVRVSRRKAYKANFHRLPARALTAGRGWEQKDEQPIPPFGKLHYFTSFRLAGREAGPDGDRRVRIKAKLVVTYEGIGPTQASRLELTKQKGGGHLVFDERGLLMEEKLHSRVDLSIKAVAGTQNHTVESETVRWLTAFRKAE